MAPTPTEQNAILTRTMAQKYALNQPHAPRRLQPIQKKPIAPKCGLTEKPKTLSLQKLTKLDRNWYRLSFYENVCLNLLQAGYHLTFTELFQLVEQQKEDRLRAGPSSALWTVTPLSQQPYMLQASANNMIQAERAYWARDFDTTYINLLKTAAFFQLETKEDWLVQHFLWISSDVAIKTEKLFGDLKQKYTDSGFVGFFSLKDLDALLDKAKQRVSEAVFHIITFLIEKGEMSEAYVTARQLYEKLKVSPPYNVPPRNPDQEADSKWKKHAPSMLAVVCEYICQGLLYKAETEKSAKSAEKFRILFEALEFASESGNQGLVGKCNLAISEVYKQMGDYESAHRYAYEYYRLSENLDCLHRVAACTALAQVYEQLGDITYAQRLLVKLERFAAACNDPAISMDVDSLVAKFHIRQTQDFAKAQQNAENGLRQALQAENTEQAKTLRLWCGVAKADSLLVNFGRTVLCAPTDPESLLSLLQWRSNRVPMKTIDQARFREVTNFTMEKRRQQAQQNRQHTSTQSTPTTESDSPQISRGGANV